MPYANEIMSRLEGLSGFIGGSSDDAQVPSPDLAAIDTQAAYDWIEACKVIMRSHQRRNLATWELAYLNDIDEDSDVIVSAACTLYGILLDFHDVTTMLAGRFEARNVNSTFAYDATAGLAATSQVVLTYPANAVTAISEFHGYTWTKGVVYTTGITAAAEDVAGTSYGAALLGAFFLFTDDS